MWRELCMSQRAQISNPYLRAMFAFLTLEGDNYDTVLYTMVHFSSAYWTCPCATDQTVQPLPRRAKKTAAHCTVVCSVSPVVSVQTSIPLL
ncbi:hypothetical protein J6590_107623 [Homalodisca vitripennis]|nr:hypothetical protein J6590_107623 [Homalodisca vitripennis]